MLAAVAVETNGLGSSLAPLLTGGVKVVDGSKDAASDRLSGDLGKEALQGLERSEPGPTACEAGWVGKRRARTGGRREVAGPARIVGEPGDHFGVFVRGVVVHHVVDYLAGRDSFLDLVEEGDELAVPVARTAPSEDRAFRRPQSGEKRRGEPPRVSRRLVSVIPTPSSGRPQARRSRQLRPMQAGCCRLLEQTTVIVPIDPLDRGIFDGLGGSPRFASADHLGFLENVDALGPAVDLDDGLDLLEAGLPRV